MRKNILTTLALFVATMMLSGCIVPFWVDDGYRGGGGGGHRDNGRHGGRR